MERRASKTLEEERRISADWNEGARGHAMDMALPARRLDEVVREWVLTRVRRTTRSMSGSEARGSGGAYVFTVEGG